MWGYTIISVESLKIELPRINVQVRGHKNCILPVFPVPNQMAFYRLFYIWFTRVGKDPLYELKDLEIVLQFDSETCTHGRYFGEYKGVHIIRISDFAASSRWALNRVLVHELHHLFKNLCSKEHVVVKGFKRRMASGAKLEVEEEECKEAEREFDWVSLMDQADLFRSLVDNDLFWYMHE